MRLKLKVDLLGMEAGSIIQVDQADPSPLAQFWRRRAVDSEIDGCVEVIEENTTEDSPEVVDEDEV